jgi:hypothetical protein
MILLKNRIIRKYYYPDNYNYNSVIIIIKIKALDNTLNLNVKIFINMLLVK